MRTKKDDFKFVLFENPSTDKREIYKIPIKVYENVIKGKTNKSIILTNLLDGEEILFADSALFFLIKNSDVY
jgi:hypothetical protein